MIGLDEVDWSRPWLEPYRDSGQRVAARVRAGASVAQALDAEAAYHTGVPTCGALPRFVAATKLPPGVAYEIYIAETAGVPTRDNLHDFFNGLVWWRHPVLKQRLNRLHADHIARHGAGPRRGALRDAATLFDENAALLCAPPALVGALRDHDWARAFVAQRASWQPRTLCLFGHALLEKLVRPRKAITAHVWVVDDRADAAAGLSAARLAAKPFLVLPVLGVPGWWPANTDTSFYGDTNVFRPQPGRKPSIERYRSPVS